MAVRRKTLSCGISVGKEAKFGEPGLGVWWQHSPGLMARALLFLTVIHSATKRHDSGYRA